MYYAVFDDSGLPTAFYNDEINADLPQNTVQITEDQWLQFINNAGRRRWDNGAIVEYEPPEPPAPVAEVVTDRQFIQALAEEPYKIISWEEAHAWGSRGELPKMLVDAVDKIDDSTTRSRVIMFLSSATSYERSHPTTAQLGQILQWTDKELDDLWNFASTL